MPGDSKFEFHWGRGYCGKSGENEKVLPLRHFHDAFLAGCSSSEVKSEERHTVVAYCEDHKAFADHHHFQVTAWHVGYRDALQKVFYQHYHGYFYGHLKRSEKNTCAWIFPQWLVSEIYQVTPASSFELLHPFPSAVLSFAKDISDAMKIAWENRPFWNPGGQYLDMFAELIKTIDTHTAKIEAHNITDDSTCDLAECFYSCMDTLPAALETIPMKDKHKEQFGGKIKSLKDDCLAPLQNSLREKIKTFRPQSQVVKDEPRRLKDMLQGDEHLDSMKLDFLKELDRWGVEADAGLHQEMEKDQGVLTQIFKLKEKLSQATTNLENDLNEFGDVLAKMNFDAAIVPIARALKGFYENVSDAQQKRNIHQLWVEEKAKFQKELSMKVGEEKVRLECRKRADFLEREIKEAQNISRKILQKLNQEHKKIEKEVRQDHRAVDIHLNVSKKAFPPSRWQYFLSEVRAFMKGLSIKVGEMIATVFSVIPVALGGTWGAKGLSSSSYSPSPNGPSSGVVGTGVMPFETTVRPEEQAEPASRRTKGDRLNPSSALSSSTASVRLK